MIASSAGVIAGLALLAWAADQLVVGAARLAVALRVSAVVVGAGVIGLGTSAPEILISVLAAAEGSVELAAGNIVGSNIANVALVAAVAALIVPLQASSTTLRREAPLSALAVIAFGVMLQVDLPRLGGVVLLLALPLGVVWIGGSSVGGHDDAVTDGEGASRESGDLRREAARTILALIGTAAGAQLVVTGAEGIATETGIGEGFVGLTVVAIGTALPELVTAVQAGAVVTPTSSSGTSWGATSSTASPQAG